MSESNRPDLPPGLAALSDAQLHVLGRAIGEGIVDAVTPQHLRSVGSSPLSFFAQELGEGLGRSLARTLVGEARVHPADRIGMHIGNTLVEWLETSAGSGETKASWLARVIGYSTRP